MTQDPFVAGAIQQGAYFDSVTLMRVARDLQGLPGVQDAAVVMGTPENREILAASELLVPEFSAAAGTDLLVAVRADDRELAQLALSKVADLLKDLRKSSSKRRGGALPAPRSQSAAIEQLPGANLALISVRGQYAADEAALALRRGLHVMLFSDNVPLAGEIHLKQLADEMGLLVMGPDCGTAIINGVPLGFANVVRRGNIGVVGAAGTGVQEVTSIIANAGGGVSQALGTGGRDVKAEVGGITFLAGLRALAQDPATKVLLLVAKPPDQAVLEKIESELKAVDKPVVKCFIGAGSERDLAPTLEQAALLALALDRGEDPSGVIGQLAERSARIKQQAHSLAAAVGSGRRFLRGLFSGGSFAAEAQVLLSDRLHREDRDNFVPSVNRLESALPAAHWYSNAPIAGFQLLANPLQSRDHTILDLGADEFTQGRPHPMIDYDLRLRRLALEAADSRVAVLLFDVVLGYGSHLDPASALVPAIEGLPGEMAVICSVTGTDQDPQCRANVVSALTNAGALVMESNAVACELAAELVGVLAQQGEDGECISENVKPPLQESAAGGNG